MKEKPLPIVNEDGHLRDDATAYFSAICMYPNDLQSISDMRDYLMSKQNRMFLEREEYVPSAFTNSVDMLLSKGIGRRVIAGLVCIYLYRLIQSGNKRPRVRSAAYQAEMLIDKLKKSSGPNPVKIPWREGKQHTFRMERIVSSVNNIETRFNEFSSIGCLMASRLTVPLDHNEPLNVQELNFDLGRLLATAELFEKIIFESVPELFPEAWSVRATKIRWRPADTPYGFRAINYPLFD